MSLVLNEKYNRNAKLFYANRLLRLMPVWWIVLIITIVANEWGVLAALGCCNSPTGVMQPSSDYPTWERVRGIANNILLFPVALETMITGEFGRPMAAGQMYTVGLEMLFYMLAPFLARANTRVFFALLIMAGVIHIIPHLAGLPSRPWQYEFFPAVLLFFLLGMASHRLYAILSALPFSYNSKVGWLMMPCIIAYAYFNHDVAAQDFTNNRDVWGLYLLVCLAMPFLFAASKASQIDRFVGDLSYPIYASHFLVMAWVENRGIADVSVRHWIALGVVVSFAALLAILVEGPLQRCRLAVFTHYNTLPQTDNPSLCRS
jgi:peptidoglycan/LPS O-acetylase OafA/YrhL